MEGKETIAEPLTEGDLREKPGKGLARGTSRIGKMLQEQEPNPGICQKVPDPVPNMSLFVGRKKEPCESKKKMKITAQNPTSTHKPKQRKYILENQPTIKDIVKIQKESNMKKMVNEKKSAERKTVYRKGEYKEDQDPELQEVLVMKKNYPVPKQDPGLLPSTLGPLEMPGTTSDVRDVKAPNLLVDAITEFPCKSQTKSNISCWDSDAQFWV